MEKLIIIYIFISGLIVGSFLNCFIYRLKKEKSLSGRSFCPRCEETLSALELVPILSYLFLAGRCKSCGQEISFQYPLVELATGLLFLGAFFLYPPVSVSTALLFFLSLFIFSGLVVLFVYDLKHYILPNKVIYPLILAALVFVSVPAFFSSRPKILIDYLLAGLISFLFFYSIYFLTDGKGMGFGDVRYSLFMGIFLGLEVIVGLFFSFLIGAIIGVILILTGKKSRKDKVPFGPFLIVGTFITLFFGEMIIDWYLNFLI